MMRRFVTTTVLPSIVLFLCLLASALVVDILLHQMGFPQLGRWLGPVGVALLAISFLHSLRRRKMMSLGSPKGLLQLHEVLGWVGALVLLVHGGIHLNAWIPWLALLAMVVVVASGLTGKVLLGEARQRLGHRRKELEALDLNPHEVERRLMAMALLTDMMKQWRSVHMPLTAAFAALALVHVLATLLLW
jgi:hypothetical protein